LYFYYVCINLCGKEESEDMKPMVVKFRKYFACARLCYVNRRIFLSEWLEDILYIPFRYGLLLIIWSAIFKSLGTNVIGGMTRQQLIMYYFMFTVIGSFSSYYRTVSNVLCKDILQGNLNRFLCRPIKYLSYLFFFGAGYNLYPCILGTVILLAVEIFMMKEFYILSFFLRILVVLIGVFITFLLHVLIGMIAFWTETIYSFKDLVLHVGSFFSGTLLPLSMFPGIMNRFSLYMPFRYMTYEPIIAFIQSPSCSEIGMILGNQMICTGIMLVLVWFVWKKGITKYEALGG